MGTDDVSDVEHASPQKSDDVSDVEHTSPQKSDVSDVVEHASPQKKSQEFILRSLYSSRFLHRESKSNKKCS